MSLQEVFKGFSLGEAYFSLWKGFMERNPAWHLAGEWSLSVREDCQPHPKLGIYGPIEALYYHKSS